MTLVLRYSARSDRGLVRQNNQDSVYAGPRLLAVADGMGGHAAGEVASPAGHRRAGAPRRRRPRRRPARRAARGHRRRQPAITRRRRGLPRPRGHGHHAHRDPVRRRPARPRPRRRLARLPAARRRALADHARRHVRPDADRRRPDHRGGGEHAPAALAAAARHHRAGRRAVALDARGPPRRPLPALLRRPVRRGQRGDARRDARPATATRASAPTG